MHLSSIENMQLCYDRFVRGSFLDERGSATVLELGAADVNGSYRAIYSASDKVRYVGADLEPGPGVDMVLTDPYKIPLPDRSVDVVISGQMLEHCEFFWLAFAEMMRVVREDGLVVVIAPSGGPIHRFPVDCYRFYPDAFHALAKYVGCHAVDVWHDERGPWNDLVGVFSWRPALTQNPDDAALPALPENAFRGAAGPEKEVVGGRADYLEVLARLHAAIEPRLYLEIGVRSGRSLVLARGEAIGVDPDPAVKAPEVPNHRLVRATSDAFFRSPEAASLADRLDLAFIDGNHLFEYALRDFMNIERRARPTTIVVVDDIFPNHPEQAERERRTAIWTGDVWKLADCLARHRPDLTLMFLDTEPTGLLLIAGLDPANRALWNAYNPITARYCAPDMPVPDAVIARTAAIDPAASAVAELAVLMRRLRDHGAPVAAVRRHIAAAKAKGAAGG